jgi:hypothetical protein
MIAPTAQALAAGMRLADRPVGCAGVRNGSSGYIPYVPYLPQKACRKRIQAPTRTVIMR